MFQHIQRQVPYPQLAEGDGGLTSEAGFVEPQHFQPEFAEHTEATASSKPSCPTCSRSLPAPA